MPDRFVSLLLLVASTLSACGPHHGFHGHGRHGAHRVGRRVGPHEIAPTLST